MAWGVMHALGGLGLFLLGMTVMSEGLKSLAHDRLRALLSRFTRSPTTGAATGAITTAIIQSSSATTVAAVGFVGAGLLTFPQSLGIIFGANIGTTITGWLVAILGFKFKLGDAITPLILIGVFLRLFGSRRLSALGYALAGFGLIFVGIRMLQEGMQAFSGLVTPESFPDDTFTGRLLLVLIGVAITIVTQSSSAGVAAAMAAL
ncbi:MAG: Na/Pi symporter, partial [Pirellulales bacterium]|nr:Na/Pi symporter [Pirellulales bacterium]